jgi:hypothetical protein
LEGCEKFDASRGAPDLRLERAKKLLAAKGFNVSRTVPACYAGSGFSDELRATAAERPDVRLIGLEDLYRDAATGSS